MLWPSACTNRFATRCPSPVFSMPFAKKNDTTMSQMTSLLVAANACAKVSVPVATQAVMARKAQAPTGSGSSTSPSTMVAKMASRDQPCTVVVAGVGSRIPRLTAYTGIQASQCCPGQGSPCLACAVTPSEQGKSCAEGEGQGCKPGCHSDRACRRGQIWTHLLGHSHRDWH